MDTTKSNNENDPNKAQAEKDGDRPNEPSSCWEIDSPSLMTSRPHFKAANLRSTVAVGGDVLEHEPLTLKLARGRRRSRSVGFQSDGSCSSQDDSHAASSNTPLAMTSGPGSNHSGHSTGTDNGGSSDWKDLWLPPTQQKECIAVPPRRHSAESPHRISSESLVEAGDNKLAFSSGKIEGKPTMNDSIHDNQNSALVTGDNNPDINHDENPLWISIMFGLINATIVLPVTMSFSSIIYREEAFAPYMPVLVKLVTISGMIHQICFSTFSSLPFAVGQVQDAGLIFLSTMASFIVQHCEERGYDDTVMLATTTVCLPLATALLGVGLLALGQAGLARFVQWLPTCVLGGYLAYIGWFCGMGGIGLMAHSSSVSLTLVLKHWIHILPGVFGGLIIYVMASWLRHMAVLPCCIVALLGSFYFILWLSSATIADVSEQGWMVSSDGGDTGASNWSETWKYLRFDKVSWSVLPKLIITELSMIFVVALSSSLDVAAIELELKRPLNYNGELKMVGLSNLISGLTGGYTGSYIFSQTIFTMRAGIRSPVAGYVLALAQLVFFLVRFPVLQYIPTFFFGSLLSMICIDLLYEWLWDVRQKITPVEYLICWITFCSIQVAGVELGILVGVVFYLISQKVGLHVDHPEINNSTTAPIDFDGARQRKDQNLEDTETILLLHQLDGEKGHNNNFPPLTYGTLGDSNEQIS